MWIAFKKKKIYENDNNLLCCHRIRKNSLKVQLIHHPYVIINKH
jgi:hypothetical protein